MPTDHAIVTLSEATGIWHVCFTSARAKAEAQRLFGTDTIPTPYAVPMTQDEVIAALHRLPANRNTTFYPACSLEETARREAEVW